jgi:hypothetical protein
MPIGLAGDALAPIVAEFREMAERERKARPEVVAITSLPLGDPARAAADARAYADAGVTGIVHGWRYEDAAAFRRAAEVMAGAVRQAVG